MTTRVFKRKGQTVKGSLTVSLSFENARTATLVAKALDHIKAAAALHGTSFSAMVGLILIAAVNRDQEHDTSGHPCWCSPTKEHP